MIYMILKIGVSLKETIPQHWLSWILVWICQLGMNITQFRNISYLRKKNMKYTTRIKHNEWKDGDIICFPANQLNNKPLFDTLCKVINSKLYQFPHMAEYTPDENFEAIRIDYKFISDGTWFK